MKTMNLTMTAKEIQSIIYMFDRELFEDCPETFSEFFIQNEESVYLIEKDYTIENVNMECIEWLKNEIGIYYKFLSDRNKFILNKIFVNKFDKYKTELTFNIEVKENLEKILDKIM